jgi:nucleoside 2-deoxyribosyltransferase
MPFDPDFDDLYHYGLSAAIRSSGLLSERIDQAVFTGSVVEKVKEKIATATIVVAVLTGDNPNVFLEVGYGWGCGKPTVLLRKDGSELRFDVQSEKCISYTSIKDCEEKLATELRGLIS